MADLYNPLTYHNLMAGLAMHFAQRPRQSLETVEEVEGPGVYALFYAGGFRAYSVISGEEKPIYVGKAVPPGPRKGKGVNVSSPALRQRLQQHAKSVRDAENLNLADFTHKHMAIEPVWITLAERFLIEQYGPVWNLCLDGFGNHAPGSGRSNTRSWWDTLHPGRSWAANLSGRDPAEAEDKVVSFLNEG